MNEQLVRIFAIGWSAWRYRWLAVATAWIVAAALTVMIQLTPARYEASARIFVDTQTILRPLMSGITVQPNVEQQVAMLGRTLITRTNVEKVAAMAGLDLSDGVVAKSDRRIEELTKALQIQSVGRDNIYTLAYRDVTPEQAKRVVDSMVAVFVQSSVGATRKDSDSAKAFIDDQIRAYQIKLEEAESRLKQFRIKNIDMQANDGRDTAARMAELATQLDAARLQMREAEQSREAARAALANERTGGAPALPDLLSEATVSVTTPEIDARIEAQKRNLDTLLQRFTEQHPDVIAARRMINELSEMKAKEVASLRAKMAAVPPAQPSHNSSLAYQELTRIAATADVQYAAARARLSEYQARLDQLRARLKDAPRIEAEAAQLNRDYAIQRKAYEDLVTRRESAAMYGKLDDAAGLAEFRVIDPARVPLKPVSPDRPLLLAGALVLSLAAGLALAFGMAQAMPVFHRASEFREKLNLPLLGSIGAISGLGESRRARWELAGLSAASGSLVLLFAVGIALVGALRPV